MSTLDPDKKAYSIAQAVKALDLSERAIREEIYNSRLLAKKFGKKILIPAASLDEWLNNLPDA